MIDLRVIRNEPPRDGYSAETDSDHYLLGLWLEGDVREGGDDYDIERLWLSIGAHLRGDGPKVSQTGDAFIIRVEGRIATVWPNPYLAIPKPLVIPLDDFGDATERWFDVVAPDVATSLRRIRATWGSSTP